MKLLTYLSSPLAWLISALTSYSAAVALAICVLPLNVNADDALPVPDYETYGAFLLDDWKASRPTLIMMLDPFCPYCIRSLEKRENLRNYNVFLFWTPILGKASETRVAEIFNCQFITGEEVVSAVIARESPECALKNIGADHIAQNQVMANAYDPQSVPAYYFGGHRVGLTQLNRYVNGIASLVGNVAMDWQRYEMFKVSQASNRAGQVAVILPKNFQHWDRLLEEVANAAQLEWHLVMDFEGSGRLEFCKVTEYCGSMSMHEYQNKRAELITLFDLSEIRAPTFIMNGKLLNRYESEKLLGVGTF